jgi:hypothetical protein
MDPRAPSVLHGCASICVHKINEKEDVMFELNTMIQASIKDQVYEMNVCFSQSGLVS